MTENLVESIRLEIYPTETVVLTLFGKDRQEQITESADKFLEYAQKLQCEFTIYPQNQFVLDDVKYGIRRFLDTYQIQGEKE